MKKIASCFVLLIIAMSSLQAQTWCGMEHDHQYEQFYKSLPNSSFQPSSSRASTIYVPVYYHLIGAANRTGTMRLAEVLQSHCELNQAYASADIQFYIVGIDSIFNQSYYVFANSNTGDAIMRALNVPNVCNIYINDDPRGVCGYAYFPGSGPNGGGIFIKKGCYGKGSTTLIHEMGHYCGLPHTFETYGGIEYVDGSNCTNAGDRFCDTPADFLDYRWSCPYTGNQTDPQGALYKTKLDGSLFMSYSNDGCQNRFSAAQKTYMYNTLKNQRSSLVNNGFTGFVQFDTTSLVSPLAGDTTVSASNATFTWNSVPGAQYYLFQIPSPNPNVIYADTVVTDTFVTIKNLLINRAYLYRVQAFSYLSNCNSFTATRPFKTASIKIDASVKNPCLEANDGNVKITPSGVGAPYSIQWSNGDSNDSIYGLAVGVYNVTVVGSNGEIATTSVPLKSGILMESTFYVQSGKVNINVYAGEGPYTYLWSDGSTSSVSLGGVASYWVKVTDSRGCETLFTYYATAIDNIEAGAIIAEVYPNPIDKNGKFNIALIVNSSQEASINIVDMQGKKIIAQTIVLNYGQNVLSFDTPLLSQGIYVIEIKTSTDKVTKRLLVK